MPEALTFFPILSVTGSISRQVSRLVFCETRHFVWLQTNTHIHTLKSPDWSPTALLFELRLSRMPHRITISLKQTPTGLLCNYLLLSSIKEPASCLPLKGIYPPTSGADFCSYLIILPDNGFLCTFSRERRGVDRNFKRLLILLRRNLQSSKWSVRNNRVL